MDIDIKKLDTALLYLQRIADGNNPINNMPAEEDAVLNNPNVIRCMHFVKEVLEEVKRNGGFVGKKQKKKEKESFPLESIKAFAYYEDKPISKFVDQINEKIDTNRFQKLSYKMVQQWLKDNDLLEERFFEEYGKAYNVPTPRGEQIGMLAEKRNVRGNNYVVTIYNKQAQEFLVSNMDKIVNV